MMSGLEEEPEFDFDFLFEFNESDEGAGSSSSSSCKGRWATREGRSGAARRVNYSGSCAMGQEEAGGSLRHRLLPPGLRRLSLALPPLHPSPSAGAGDVSD